MNWVIINEAAKAPLYSHVTLQWTERLAAACQLQLNAHVAPIYGGSYAVRAGADRADVQPGESVFAIVDSLPDAPDAVAYHDVAGAAVPVAFLAMAQCYSLDDVSTAASHEFVEAAGDAACNAWRDDGAGTEWCQELCDAVESNGYGVNGLKVSDFLLPAFFAPNAKGPYSYMEANGLGGLHPLAPFTTASGGYKIKREAGTNESQVTAHLDSRRGARVSAGLHHWSSRAARRGVKRRIIAGD